MNLANRGNTCRRGHAFRCSGGLGTALLLLGAAGLAAPARGAEGGKCGPHNPFRAAPVCVQEYALCISAPCVESPRQAGAAGPSRAECVCEVVYGASIGSGSCASRAPAPAKGGTRLVSTYSFQQNLPQYRLTTCKEPAGGPALRYTDCYNQPCLVDPHDSAKATCTCPILETHGGSFITRGGDCGQPTCSQLWSGAPAAADDDVNWQLACDLGMPTPPDPQRCPL